MIKSIDDLDIYKLSYNLAMFIFNQAKVFPREEKYSLTDQLIRSSRSVCANIAEGWGKRIYENEFKRHLVYAMGSLEETKTRLIFAMDCHYISTDDFNNYKVKYDEIGSKLFKLYSNWKSF